MTLPDCEKRARASHLLWLVLRAATSANVDEIPRFINDIELMRRFFAIWVFD